ncbi:MAG: B-box zinc finger protein [Chloroflexi bacterium]|nr:B-box zinc finger protein [Chloroflexota bacterium]
MTDQTFEDTQHDHDEVTYCEVHPDRETGLRCNRCGRYMCAQCAVQTPVGYRCRECVREVEDKFFSGTQSDYVIAFAVAAAAAAVGGFLLIQLRITGILLLMIFAALPAGGALAQLIFRVVGKRRGRYTAQIAAAGVLIGAAGAAFLTGGFRSIGLWIFASIVAALVYGRFRLN